MLTTTMAMTSAGVGAGAGAAAAAAGGGGLEAGSNAAAAASMSWKAWATSWDTLPRRGMTESEGDCPSDAFNPLSALGRFGAFNDVSTYSNRDPWLLLYRKSKSSTSSGASSTGRLAAAFRSASAFFARLSCFRASPTSTGGRKDDMLFVRWTLVFTGFRADQLRPGNTVRFPLSQAVE